MMNWNIPEKVRRKGLCLNDTLYLYPTNGRKRHLSLCRTSLLIETQNLSLPIWRQNMLCLQKISGISGRWRMQLIGEGEEGRYFLEALNDIPFILNGTPCLKAWPLRGDKLLFDYNLIQGRAPSLDRKEEELDRLIPLPIVESDLSILLEGETGTGKSSLARQIHEKSLVEGNFVALNIRSFNLQLLESELFGHIRGAFTGAFSNKKGALSLAEGGTLFLDEIDNLPTDIQVKLLLFLDSQEYRPVGSEVVRKVKTRMLFASSRPMDREVRLGKCRPDFYFRISQGAVIKMRPLRKSQEQLNTTLSKICQQEGFSLDEKLRQFYLSYAWPGNYRQLTGHLKRKGILSNNGQLKLDAVDYSLLQIKAGELTSLLTDSEECMTLKNVKRHYIWQVYMEEKGNIKRAADKLGISSNTVKRALREVKIHTT